VETGLNRNKPSQQRHCTEHPENHAWIFAVAWTKLLGTLAAAPVPVRPRWRESSAVKRKKSK
jgi:hypothetical protein